jgi:signal transduction histidine kinase
VGLVIVVISSIYTYYVVEKLRNEERGRMELYRQSQEIFINTPGFDTLPENVKSFITGISLNNKTIPVVLVDDRMNIIDAQNFKGIDSIMQTASDTAYIQKQLDNLILSSNPIIVYQADGSTYNRIYYDDSLILTLLKYYPIFQFILIALFIGFGYLAFSSARRNEQNQVWVGMAKETAHQLGTPIAAMLGWIEHLKTTHEGDEMTQQVVTELEKDVSRLDLVADRFSKIGSAPELTPVNIFVKLEECRNYMQKRASRKIQFEFPSPFDNPPLFVKINAHLFDWVVENLLRNALDALEGDGKISAVIYQDKDWICIDISDTGKGISSSKFKTIFQPGFTTKKRGWGLGLSLAKRIIENYHGGKIYVKDSVVGKHTTFTIKLPKFLATPSVRANQNVAVES